MKRATFLLCAAAWCARPSTSQASADFEIEAHGEGFSDATPVRPVGGNHARTLGAQRLAAVKYAASLWGKLLDSPVPIVVDVEFSDLGCEKDGKMTLAAASPTDFAVATSTAEDGRRASFAMGLSLANRLKGSDVDPERADIDLHINTQVDEGCGQATGGWYLGLDGKAGAGRDLVDALLHELAHGLGFVSLVDDDTGALPTARDERGQSMPIADVFTANIVDVASGRPWLQLSAAERLRSLTTPRGAVWDGPNVRAVVEKYLTQGEPRIALEPPIAGFSGLLGDGGAGKRAGAAGVQGPLYLLPEAQPCSAPADVKGRVVLVDLSVCRLGAHEVALQQAGASAILVVMPATMGDAPPSLAEPAPEQGHLDIPMLTLASADGARLRAEQSGFPRRVRVFSEMSRYAGADAQGRPYLYTNHPVDPGSTVSHFDSLARPDLLMEPLARQRHTHDVDLTRALLADVGWTATCGNGQLDPGEVCDDGSANRDSANARCHTTCRPPRCGDGIVAAGEACDEGTLNNDDQPGACSSACRRNKCGAGQGGCDGDPTASPRAEPDAGTLTPWSPIDDDAPGGEGCQLVAGSSAPKGLAATLLSLLALLALRRRRARI